MSIKPNPEHPSDSTDLSPPSLELEAYAGTYSDAGYGSIVLCTPNTNTPHCRNVLKDFEPFPNPFANKSSPILYAAYQTTLSTHVRLRHQQGDAFGITMTYLFPNGYGRDSTAFETYESGESEGKVNFVVSDQDEVVGFGLFIMEELTERRRLGGTIEEIADVWFTKVSTPEA